MRVCAVFIAIMSLFVSAGSYSLARADSAFEECIAAHLTLDNPVSGSVDEYLANPENIEKILGPANPEPLKPPATRAMLFLNDRTAGLKSSEKARIWTALAEEIHRRFPSWNSTGPYVVHDGAFVFQGERIGTILVIRARDGAVFVGSLRFTPRPEWEPNYRSLTPLDNFLSNRRR